MAEAVLMRILHAGLLYARRTIKCLRLSRLKARSPRVINKGAPSKSSLDSQDSADFVTVRVLKGNLSALVTVEKREHVRVHGFLQSRDYEESLADFLKDARGGDLRAPRGTTEVIARRIMSQRNGKKKK
jgi:hypothetical protein